QQSGPLPIGCRGADRARAAPERARVRRRDAGAGEVADVRSTAVVDRGADDVADPRRAGAAVRTAVLRSGRALGGVPVGARRPRRALACGAQITGGALRAVG